ncbi:hypothetical protein QH494_19800 [Sphingomonas sp. AR_OL41]|uniref:hypothetical protein n=1 Tax=Sphingomonas sp. AR_OL41 TaxID=3042729 RepID=UPI0024807416|nr:hypothetical protein [Sphingomonas sp. AR_OL41]MDH7974439.1 hypothetical protein [Sphingomonas sp. AR_OL41]
MPHNPGIPVSDANALPIAGSRVVGPIKSSTPIANSAATYAAPKSVGPIIIIPTGLPAGTTLVSATVKIKALFADVTTAVGFNYIFFDAAPTATPDNTSPAFVAADLAKALGFAAAAAVVGTTGTLIFWTLQVPRMNVDASGNIYLALNVSSTMVLASANCLSWEFNGLY